MTVQVTGLRELRAELKIADAAFPKELQQANKAVSELVAEGTRAAFTAMGHSAVLVAPTVRAYASGLRAQVAVGMGSGVGADVAMGNLWGSKRFPQFPARVASGYALFPTIEARTTEIVEVYGVMLDVLTRKAFPN